MMNLSQYKEKLIKARGKCEHLKNSLRLAVSDGIAMVEDRDNLEKAQIFLQKVAQDTQNQLRFHIKDIVQLCLDTIWPGEVVFDVLFEINRGKTEARLIFVVDGEEVDPLDADGGGLVQVAAFALRIAVWTLGTTRNSIVLDEPFVALSDNLQPLAAEVIKELSDKLGLQFIMVTHRKELTGIADRIFEVNRKRVSEYWQSEVKVI
jgi:DNA repair exonuclease SbcCD ATPase subunit